MWDLVYLYVLKIYGHFYALVSFSCEFFIFFFTPIKLDDDRILISPNTLLFAFTECVFLCVYFNRYETFQFRRIRKSVHTWFEGIESKICGVCALIDVYNSWFGLIAVATMVDLYICEEKYYNIEVDLGLWSTCVSILMISREF